uniref:Uncharacterized protein n=1 Tax=Arundo donax TaxID=35708 RepID=A0A0A9H2D9_ARUDO
MFSTFFLKITIFPPINYSTSYNGSSL